MKVMFCVAIAGLASVETVIGKKHNGFNNIRGDTYAPSTGVTVNIKSIPMAYCSLYSINR